MEMTGYLPEHIIDELGKARNKKLEKNISMKVRFNDKFYPIIKFSDNSFSIKAMEDIKLRGLVDIYSNNFNIAYNIFSYTYFAYNNFQFYSYLYSNKV